MTAIANVVEKKKAKIKAIKEEAAAGRPAPKEPVEKVQIAMERVLEVVQKERVNLKYEDIVRIQAGLTLINDILVADPPEIADPLMN